MLQDLAIAIQEWTDQGYNPIVMGDFNSPPTDNDFLSFMEKNGLFDLIDSANDGPPPRTYVDGRKDLILC